MATGFGTQQGDSVLADLLPCHRQSTCVVDRPRGDDWTPASAVDRDSASGLVSSLVISLVVKLTFSLRTRGNGLYLRLQPLPWRSLRLHQLASTRSGCTWGAVADRPDSGGA